MKIIEQYKLLSLAEIKQKYDNPRKIFDDDEMDDLVNSIGESGVLNPIWCSLDNGEYFLIAGERRLRASKSNNLTEIPARIFELADEKEARILQTVENEQRADLTQKERYEQLQKMKSLGMTIVDMAKMTGINSTTIRGYLALEDLDESIFKDQQVQDFAKTQIAKLKKDEQKIIANKLKNEDITGRQLYADVVKNLRNLESDSTLNKDQKSFIRSEVIHNVDRDLKAKNIIMREKMRIEMTDKGEIPEVITDEIMQSYIDETHKYAKKVIEMDANNIQFANPTLVSQLGLGLVQVYNAINNLRERIDNG